MFTKKLNLLLLIALIGLFSCNKSPTLTLEYDLEHDNLPISSEYIIACAAGMPEGFMDESDFPVSMFFYPVNGASNFKYYETLNHNIDPNDYSLYLPIEVSEEYVFNGYLRRLPIIENKNDRWGIVTYEVNGKVRICDPVHIKVDSQPTIWKPNSISIMDNGINPEFSWDENINHNNKIHFQVVSDTSDNLISGTYTYDNYWNFYDLSNVVLNITDPSNTPILDNLKTYNFTLMSVTEDNWVNLFGQKPFYTQ